MDITNKIDQFLGEAYEKVKGTKMKNGEFYSDFMEIKKQFTDANNVFGLLKGIENAHRR